MFKKKPSKTCLAIREIREILTKLFQKEPDYTEINNKLKETLEELLIPKINKIDEMELKVEKRLAEFHKEIIDKYFNSINTFMRWNKEISLVSHLEGKNPDMTKLKQELMKPYLDDKWRSEKVNNANKINEILNSKGEEIRKKRETTYQEYLKADREGTGNREELKIKLETIDEILKR